jgi:hypothetical protein
MWPTVGGIRIPTEVFGTGGAGNASAVMEIDLYVATASQAGSSVTLNAQQAAASVLVIGTMSSTTNNLVNFPAANPGASYFVKNSSGSACTVKVTGQTGTSVANGSHAILVMNKTDIEQWSAAF